jgi:hypothetical protein
MADAAQSILLNGRGCTCGARERDQRERNG